jgi:hypothetical protein
LPDDFCNNIGHKQTWSAHACPDQCGSIAATVEPETGV